MAGVVAVFFEHLWQSETLGFEHGTAERSDDAVEVAPVVATGQEGVAARRADAGGRVAVGEAESGGGEAVEVRGFVERVPVATEIRVAEVVGEEDDDVGLFC